MRLLTEDEQTNLSHFAELLFSDEQLAALLEMHPKEFRIEMMKKGSAIYKTVTASRIKSEASVREGVLAMAQRGSTPAQTIALKYVEQMKIDNA